MTLIELRSTCAQIASSYMVVAKDPEDTGIEVACEIIAERIQAIPLPEQEAIAALEKQIEELETALRDFVRYADDVGDDSHEFDRAKSLLDKIETARERAK